MSFKRNPFPFPYIQSPNVFPLYQKNWHKLGQLYFLTWMSIQQVAVIPINYFLIIASLISYVY